MITNLKQWPNEILKRQQKRPTNRKQRNDAVIYVVGEGEIPL